jgi:tetratricopeptide (TPR) repeat protein
MNKKNIKLIVVLFVASWLGLAGLLALLVKVNIENQKLKNLSFLFEKKSKLAEEELTSLRKSESSESQALDYLQWRFILREQVYDAGNRIRSQINAIKDLKKNRELSSLLYYNLGLNCFLAGDFKSAITAFEEAVNLNPKDTESYYNLGLLYSTYSQNYKKAINFYKKYLEFASANSPKAKEIKERLAALEKKK